TPNTGSIVKTVKTTLTSEYSDVGGYANLKNLYLSPSTSVADISNKGYFLYDSLTNKLFVRGAGVSTFFGGYAPGSANVIDNGLMKLYCADTTISRVGNMITVNWSISINIEYPTASCNMYIQATNQIGKSDAWEQFGAFTLD
ncbi:MAG: hypothetical protein ACYC0V_17490, partial [Armatimonadota bacterium]